MDKASENQIDTIPQNPGKRQLQIAVAVLVTAIGFAVKYSDHNDLRRLIFWLGILNIAYFYNDEWDTRFGKINGDWNGFLVFNLICFVLLTLCIVFVESVMTFLMSIVAPAVSPPFPPIFDTLFWLLSLCGLMAFGIYFVEKTAKK